MRHLLLATAVLLAPACKRSEDEAARARMFSPEQPVGDLPQAKEQLDASRLAEDSKIARRVLHMPRAEIKQRIGLPRAQPRVQFAWARGLKLRNAGESTSDGRRVVRYAVTGFGARAGEKEETDLLPPHYPENRTDPDTARRLELWEKEEPTSASGTVVVDVQSGVPLG